MLYIHHCIKTIHFWLKYNGLAIVRKTTKLIEGGHRGLQDYRYICYYFYVFTFFTFFSICKKVVTFTFFAVFRTFSRTISGGSVTLYIFRRRGGDPGSVDVFAQHSQCWMQTYCNIPVVCLYVFILQQENNTLRSIKKLSYAVALTLEAYWRLQLAVLANNPCTHILLR